jgi:hypothetical protein
LSKTPIKNANPSDVRKVMTALHGSKIVLQGPDGSIWDSEFRVDSKRNRQFRNKITPTREEIDVLRSTGKFKRTRPAGFGTIGSARR